MFDHVEIGLKPKVFISVSHACCIKVAASFVLWDLGITDSVTEKVRTYPASYVIPVKWGLLNTIIFSFWAAIFSIIRCPYS